MYSTTLKIAEATAPYFCSRYSDKDESITLCCDKCWGKHTVNRPNHGLCHSVRQGLLAVKIAKMINLTCDLYKLQVAASFQRSGRQSEISSTNDPILYKSYEEQDVRNCLSFLDEIEYGTRELIPWSDRDASAEAITYAEAIRWDSDSDIAKVLHAAHHLDLRRIPSFDEKRIKQNVRDLLPITETQLQELWSYSGRLLHASGDRCLCCQKKSYSPIFARLSNRPKELVSVLVAVK